MLKRILAQVVLLCLLIGGAALCAPAMYAQQMQEGPTLYTYVSFWGVPREQWNDMEKNSQENRKIFEKLVADGTLVSWGSEAIVVHQDDGMTHGDWFQSTSLTGIMKTLDALRAGAQASPLLNAKHHDALMRTVIHGGKTASLKSGFLQVGFWRTKPGMDAEWIALVRKHIQPMLDDMVADGSMTMYNIDSEQIHTTAPGFHAVAIVVPNEASLDKLVAALPALLAKNPTIGPALGALVEEDAHRDILGRIIAYQHK
jgi:hypothetical protein